MQPNAPSNYTPQKPQSRPDSVTPLALSQIPKNGYNPYSTKSNPLPATIPPPSNPPPKPTSNGYHDDNEYDEGANNYNDEGDYNNDQAERPDYQNGNNGDNNGYAAEYNDRNGNNANNDQYDESISPEDYANGTISRNTDTYQLSNTTRHSPFATTSSSYGSHSPSFKRPSSPSRRPTPSSTYLSPSAPISSDPSHFGRANSYNASMNLHGNGIFGLSTGASLDAPTRGRSPSRRSESPFDTTSPSLSRTSTGSPGPSSEPPYATSPSPSRQRSSSLDRTHAPPKGLGTLGGFSQNFSHPLKFEKELAEPPHRDVGYKDSSILPPRRETQAVRSPAYRLHAASRLNSREMDHLENHMRSALSTIDAHEQKVTQINAEGYSALSPEPRAPSQNVYQSPQSRSIFSTVQPTGSPVARSVSPARFGNREDLDSDFSKTDYHKKFHTDNPNLLTTSPVQGRVHPNARSRQSAFPT
jgi:hypothetical protein